MALSSPLINLISAAARKASRSVARDFGELQNLQTSRKSPKSFAARALEKANGRLVEELENARGTAQILIEDQSDNSENPKIPASGNAWIIAGIDGLTNFERGVPFFCTSIAFARDGAIVGACIYDVTRDETFVTEKGEGAWLNRSRLRASVRRNPSDALLATEFSADSAPGLADAFGSVRVSGCPALELAYLAAGRFDAAWFPDTSIWDHAAAALLVQEAGGMVTAPDGSSRYDEKGLFAANTELHSAAMKALRDTLATVPA